MNRSYERLQAEIAGRERSEGITPADLLALSPELRRMVDMILREGPITQSEVVGTLGGEPSAVRDILDRLVEKGLLVRVGDEGDCRYQANLAHKRGSSLPPSIWEALERTVG